MTVSRALAVACVLAAGSLRRRAELAAGADRQHHHGDAALAVDPAIHQGRYPDAARGHPAEERRAHPVTLASWPERNLTGPELLRVIRSGQIDIGAPALPTVAGDVPMLEMSTSPA